jgi:hypothetical protein
MLADSRLIALLGLLEPQDRLRSEERASGLERAPLVRQGSLGRAGTDRHRVVMGTSRRSRLRTRLGGTLVEAVRRGTEGIDVPLVADPTGGGAPA